jgi:hypothetical protein
VRQDRDGRPIYAFNVLATTGVDADVLSVKVAGEIEASVGEVVRLRALTVEYWEMEGRSGVSFRAQGIEHGKPGEPARKPGAGGQTS